MIRSLVCVSLHLALLAVGSNAWAAERTAAELLPASTVVYAEMCEPEKVLQLVLDHPLAQQLLVLPEYQQALKRPQWQPFQAAVRSLEQKLELPWRKAAAALTSGGLYFGVDLPTQGFLALSQAADEKLAGKARDGLLELVRADAAAKGRADPVQVEELSGATLFTVDKLHLAVMGKWLLVSNKRLAAFMVLENYRGTGSGSLADNAHFQSVLAKRSSQPAAWAYADLRVLQQMRTLSALAKKKGNNPLFELIVGGIVDLLPSATYVTASLEAHASRVKLTAMMPGDTAEISKPRDFYFAPSGGGGAPPLLRPSGTLLTLATYRDLGHLWRHGPDLFDERVNARMAEAEGQLTTFFAGRDFRDDILGNLEPQIQLVVARRDFTSETLAPAIKLPAVGVVLRLKNPETTARVFKVTFQSLIGFLNVVGGMKKVDPLELSTETRGDAVIVSTQHLASPQSEEAASRKEGPLHFNASPTAIFAGDRFILTSARPLALSLLETTGQAAADSDALNTQVAVDGQIAQALFADNREPLVSQNMITKGHDHSAAEKEIDRLLSVASYFRELSLKLTTADKQLQLTVEAAFSERR